MIQEKIQKRKAQVSQSFLFSDACRARSRKRRMPPSTAALTTRRPKAMLAMAPFEGLESEVPVAIGGKELGANDSQGDVSDSLIPVALYMSSSKVSWSRIRERRRSAKAVQ